MNGDLRLREMGLKEMLEKNIKTWDRYKKSERNKNNKKRFNLEGKKWIWNLERYIGRERNNSNTEIKLRIIF